MSIFKEAKPEMAYLKMGVYGEGGSGKTFTATKVAIGLHRYIKSKKPITFLDTETGSDFVLRQYEEAKIKLLVAKTRAFSDLVDGIDEATGASDILICDSITHYWNEMVEAYCKKNNIKTLTLRHWQPIKKEWREYTTRYINSKIHFIMCGRAADKWEDVEDADGVKEMKKVGTKMRAETEIAYEPSLLVEMVKHHETARAGGGWINRAWVEKDRFDLINSCSFDNPGFETFLPHIERLNLGGDHKAVDMERNSEGRFDNDRSGIMYHRKHDELVENIKAEIYIAFPGQSAEEKTGRSNLMKEIFDTRSAKAVEHMNNSLLEAGLEKLKLRNEKPEPKKEKKKDVKNT